MHSKVRYIHRADSFDVRRHMMFLKLQLDSAWRMRAARGAPRWEPGPGLLKGSSESQGRGRGGGG